MIQDTELSVSNSAHTSDTQHNIKVAPTTGDTSTEPWADSDFYDHYRGLSEEGRRYLRAALRWIIDSAKAVESGDTPDYDAIRAQVPEEYAEMLIGHMKGADNAD